MRLQRALTHASILAAYMRGHAVWWAATVALAATVAAQAQTQSAGSAQAHADNYYAAGERVEISTPMAADVIVAGRQIDITRPVAGDILATGWRVVLTGRAEDDVRIAARTVVVNAPVHGDVTVAGGDVTFGPEAHVSGRSWITGGTVRLEGIVDRDLHVAGGTVQLAGEIRNPVQVIAERLEILPTARILGPVTYRGSTEARIADGAVVNGPITYTRIPESEARRARAFPTASSLLFAIHLFLAGLLVLVYLPRAQASVVDTLRRQPGKSLLTGLALLVTVPVAAVLLIVSVLGLPVGLVLGALYAIGLFAGVLATAFFVGDMEARLIGTRPIATRGQHALLLLVGVLTLALLRSLVGGLVVFLSVLFGLGALALWLYQTYSRASVPMTV